MQRTRWASKGFLSGGSQKLTSRDPVVLDGSRSRVVAFQTFPMTQGPSAGWLAKVGEGWRRLAKVGEGWRRLANSIRVTMKMVKRQAMCHRAVELAETCNTSESLGVLNLDIRFRLSQATWGSYKTEGLEGNTDSVQRYSAKHHRS